MKKFTSRKWSSLALLLVIVPVSLIATFRLTGVLKEPQTPQTITVEAVTWNMSRPTDTVLIDMWVRNFYHDLVASVNLSVHVVKYYENDPYWPASGGDYAKLRVVASLNVSAGFVYSMVIRFSQTDLQSHLYIETDPKSMKLQNLEMKRILETATYEREAYFEAMSLNQPKNSSLSIFNWWPFFDEDNTNHSITATLEATYFNGTAYLKMILPIHLNVWLDSGDSFETAKMMLLTITQVSESLGAKNDFEDYYAIWAENQRAKIEVRLVPPSNADFDLYVYNPKKELVANSTLREQGSVERTTFIIDSGGWWYIRVTDPTKLGEHGTYTLTINTTN